MGLTSMILHIILYVITPLGVLWLVYKPESRGHKMPEGGGHKMPEGEGVQYETIALEGESL